MTRLRFFSAVPFHWNFSREARRGEQAFLDVSSVPGRSWVPPTLLDSVGTLVPWSFLLRPLPLAVRLGASMLGWSLRNLDPRALASPVRCLTPPPGVIPAVFRAGFPHPVFSSERTPYPRFRCHASSRSPPPVKSLKASTFVLIKDLLISGNRSGEHYSSLTACGDPCDVLLEACA